MATTRIMPLHVGKDRTENRAISDIIDYVVNPQKTDNAIIHASCSGKYPSVQHHLQKDGKHIFVAF